MEKLLQWPARLPNSRSVPVVVLLLTLGVLAGAIWLATAELRQRFRAQIISRDGEILHAVALAQHFAALPGVDLGAQLDNPAAQFAIALNLSKIKDGVLAARLFDKHGRFILAFPDYVAPAELRPVDWRSLTQLRPVSHFRADARLTDLLAPQLATAPSTNVPLLEVTIPIHHQSASAPLGAVQLILLGQPIAAEFGALDRHLLRQALLVFAVGGAVLALTFGWAWRRLQRSQQQLLQRTDSLLRAHQELEQAAKTSAVGAVAAHLIHGLSSPLSGLQTLASTKTGADASAANASTDWQDVVQMTSRMQGLIGEIMRILGEEQSVRGYETTLGEVVDIIEARARLAAAAAGVRFDSSVRAECHLPNRHANLIILVLRNLVDNAIQATPPGRAVRLDVRTAGPDIFCEVRDDGPGLTSSVRERLFTPCHSTKPGGHGLGLAISKQLTNHLGAGLEATSSTDAGCVFTLTLPIAKLSATPDPASKATANS